MSVPTPCTINKLPPEILSVIVEDTCAGDAREIILPVPQYKLPCPILCLSQVSRGQRDFAAGSGAAAACSGSLSGSQMHTLGLNTSCSIDSGVNWSSRATLGQRQSAAVSGSCAATKYWETFSSGTQRHFATVKLALKQRQLCLLQRMSAAIQRQIQSCRCLRQYSGKYNLAPVCGHSES
ncbi:hypothetical protein B0H14DRAFT_2611446 [Mycena olivaceomarginata]|nr:hypothetical protein B0H14DRAFT_2611446 [Mycena olivaceomarginata]